MEQITHWTLRKKILIGYGVGLCLLVAVILFSLISMIHLGTASEAILKENYKSILAAENMVGSLERQDSAILLLMLGYTEEALSQFMENEHEFLLWLGRAKDNITVEGEAQIIDVISSEYSAYMMKFSNLQDLVRADKEKAASFYHESMLPSFKSVRNECIQLRQINQDTMFEASNRANALSDKTFWSVFTIGLSVIAIGLVFSIFLANFIVRPVHQIIGAVRQISEGNYDVEVKESSADELGAMAKDFNVMVKKLKAYRELNIKQILNEKHKSEAIIRSIEDGIIVLNSEIHIEDINPAAAAIFGKSIDEIKSRHLLEITRDEKLFKYVKQSFETEITALPKELETNVLSLSRGDSQRYFLYSVTPVVADGDTVTRMVLLLRDITHLKELDRLKSEFVMAASHELKTPLTSIAMSVALLKEKLLSRLDAKESELLAAADEEVRRLRVLINDLLDISKIESGKMVFEFESVPVDTLFNKAVAVFKNQADEKSIELSYSIADDLSSIRADVNKITWVLTNLISNALRYTDTNGFIKLSAHKAGSQIYISVADNGSGIPYEYQSRIFDKFVQVKSQKSLGGSGLGLSICKEIVRAHGGTIWVESQPGKGCTFTFTVPLKD